MVQTLYDKLWRQHAVHRTDLVSPMVAAAAAIVGKFAADDDMRAD